MIPVTRPARPPRGVLDLKQHPEKGGMAGAVFGIVMGCLGSAVIALAIIAPHT